MFNLRRAKVYFGTKRKLEQILSSLGARSGNLALNYVLKVNKPKKFRFCLQFLQKTNGNLSISTLASKECFFEGIKDKEKIF